MIVLDTNVISELMRSDPHPDVLTWAAAQPRTTLYTTSITRAEIMTGIALMPEGRRRTALADLAIALFSKDLGGRILPFDADAADRYSEIVATRRAIGAPIAVFDAQIAATAAAAGAAVATRDVGGFRDCGLTLIDPWTTV